MNRFQNVNIRLTVLITLLIFANTTWSDTIINPFEKEFIDAYIQECMNREEDNKNKQKIICNCEAHAIYDEFSLMELISLEQTMTSENEKSDEFSSRIEKWVDVCKEQSEADFDGINRFHVQVPTVQQETDSAWQTIVDITFFDQYGYSVNLPDHPLIDTLLEKSRNKQLNDQDYAQLKKVLEDHVYKPEDYQQSVDIVNNALPLANQILNTILTMDLQWTFKSFDRYEIQLTLYGPGGSYRPDTGAIIMLTNPQGGFKNYADPTYTIVHEVVHIGIEDSIVQALNLSHAMKEHAVDVFVKTAFAKELPDYKIQPMGESNLMEQIDSIDDLLNFKTIIEGT